MTEKELIMGVREGTIPFEEVIKRYEDFLWKKLRKTSIAGYEREELYNIGLNSLWKAVTTYTGDYTYLTLAGKIIDNDIKILIRKARRKGHGEAQYENFERLNKRISTSEITGFFTEIGDLIPSNLTSDSEVFKQDFIKHVEECFNQLKEEEKEILLWFWNDNSETQKELAERLGFKRPSTVSRRLAKAKGQLTLLLKGRDVTSDYLK